MISRHLTQPVPSRPAALALAIAAVLAVAAPAARAQEERPGVFGEVLDVRVVNLEVVVTDRDGNRVRGLEPADFALEVDGREVPIDFFSEVVGGTVAASAGGGPAGVPGAAPGTALPTSWLVFVDDYFSIGRERDEVLESLAGQVGHLAPQDRMAIVAFDGRRLEMLTSWTGSKPALERALTAARERRAYGLERVAERRRFAADRGLAARPRFGGGFGGRGELDLDERQYVEQLAAQLRRSTAAAAATLRAFASPPGRKVMLLLSGGWPWEPADYALDGRPLTRREAPGGEEIYGPLVDTANLLGYTLYPVDVAGFTGSAVDASRSMPGDSAREFRAEQELHASLVRLAGATGGRAFLDAARLTALSDASDDTRSFYWLGFTPQRHGDGAAHEVTVKVRRPGLRVRLREGFRDLSRQAEVSMAVESALLFGNAPSAAPLALTLGPPDTRGRRVRVPLEILVPIGELTAVPVGEEWVVAVELRVAAQDDEGNLAPIPVLPLELRRTTPAQEGEMARYATSVELRRSPHDLVVALYEPASGKVFSAAARITP